MAACEDGGGGSARRRHERRLRSFLCHERMAVARALAESTHHSAQRQKTARAGRRHELRSNPPPPPPPLPQAAGAQYSAMDAGEDGGEAPAAGRPAPLLEVLPQAGLGRYCGCGFELVLDVTVSQMEREVIEAHFNMLRALLTMTAGRGRVRGRGERVQQRTVEQFADTIPDSTQNSPQKRLQQHTAEQIVNRPQVRISERVVEQTVNIPAHLSGRNSERIMEQIVPLPQDISQERISERIEEQIVPVPQVLPQERISERTVEQIVPVPQVIPQERISERIQKQIIDVPVPQVIPQERISERIEGHIVEGKGTSSSAAVPLDTAEWPGNEWGFPTFSRMKKVRSQGGS